MLHKGGVMPRVINVRNIPDDLYRVFKSECALNDVDMTTAIIRFMYVFTQAGSWEVASEEKKYRNPFVALEHGIDIAPEFMIKGKLEV